MQGFSHRALALSSQGVGIESPRSAAAGSPGPLRLARSQTESAKKVPDVRFGERFVTATRPCRSNHLDTSVVNNRCGHFTELYASRMAPMGQEIGAYRKTDVLTEKAQLLGSEAFDLSLQVRRRAEFRHAQVRFRCAAYRTFGGVNQEEAVGDEAVDAAAWSVQLLKNVE